MIDNDPLWYKDAVIYEAHVRAFHDSVGDGIGDFRGLTDKLDYLEDLGVTAVWLLPFYPSPLKDDGYDIADYLDVHPDYGKLSDFREFLDAAHRRGIRVITELVINHTSDQHPWFQRARRSPPGSPERDFYVWSDTPERYRGARIIFKDFEPSNWTWDHVAGAYYWHRFYHHQPDLNYDNPAVWDAIFPLVDFWLGLGVDGLRLDAVPYLFEREGTNCENLPETHAFLRALRKHVDDNFHGRMLLAEANQWPEDAVAYFGSGDECQMAFHFPVMPRLFMAVHQEDRFPVLDILEQTPPIPPDCQWGLFLRNHDELTLEMVTDEERDYMYRAYAVDRHARINLGIRRRLAPLLHNDRRRIELMNALLFSLPGTPVIYYGDEIGMGDNIFLGDRNGVRTPMQWSADRNAGFSRANPQELYLPVIIDPEYHFEAINVESQQNNPSSLLWWTKRLIALRKRHKAFGRGTLTFLQPANAKVLAFVREYGDERILVVANLSRFVQHVELDLSRWSGLVPEELFGRSLFPPIGERLYPLSLGRHSFCWFALVPAAAGAAAGHPELPALAAPPRLEDLFGNTSGERVEALLPAYLERHRPGGAPVPITAVHIQQAFPFENESVRAWFLILQLEFRVGIPESMLLPVALIPAERAAELLEPAEVAGLARLLGPREMLLVDALAVPEYGHAVLELLLSARTLRLGDAELGASHRPGLADVAGPDKAELAPRLYRGERNTLSLHFGQRLVLKTVRRIEEGPNPDLELSRFLHDRLHFPGVAPILGCIDLRRRKRRAETVTLAVLHRYVPNQGNALQYTLDQLASFLERAAAGAPGQPPGGDKLPELIGGYLDLARLLGQRTAELHRALGSATDPALAPEPLERNYQRAYYQSLRNLTGQLCARLRRERSLTGEARELADRLAAKQAELLARFHGILDKSLASQRIRCHGDYSLGQLLYIGNSFVAIDLDGDPSRPLSERRLKRTPLRDVASMARSFDQAAGCMLLGLGTMKGRPPGLVRVEDRAALAGWAAAWVEHVSREYVAAYLRHMDGSGLLPAGAEGAAAPPEPAGAGGGAAGGGRRADVPPRGGGDPAAGRPCA